MRSVSVRAAAGVGIIALIASLSVSPAIAATPGVLAPGSTMYALPCDDIVGDTALLSVDAATADATAIGSTGGGCAGQPAWDATTQTAYYVDFNGADSLISVDTTSGETSDPIDLTTDGETTDVDSIAIGTDGAAYALIDFGLYSLDLATAVVTPVASVADNRLYSFAVDPTSGVFYTLDDDGLISTIDVATGELTTVGQLEVTPETSPYSLQVDSNGTLWFENDNFQGADLWSVDPADVAGTAVLSGEFNVDGVPFYTEALLIVPAPVEAPVITSPAPPASIPSGTAFSFQVTATGTAPIVFGISSGALPTGLTLDAATGVISGTPTVSGSFTFGVTASNAGGSVESTYTVAVAAAPAPPAPPAPPAIRLPIVSG